MDAALDTIRKNPVDKHDALFGAGIVALGTNSGISDPPRDLVIVKRIGLGTHAEVYETRPVDGDQGTRIALKVEKPIKYASGLLGSEIEVFRVAASASHKCLPTFLGEYEIEVGNTTCRAFAMEMYSETLSYVKQSKSYLRCTTTEKSDIIDYLSTELFRILFHLHDSIKYLHRDIKPSNIMYKQGSPGQVELCLVDFGSAVPIGQSNESEFRPTGAYASIVADPTNSTELDDYWAVIFCLVDMCVPGGLRWRNISGRSEEGRKEILSEKFNFFEQLRDGTNTEVPECLRSIILEMVDICIAFPDPEIATDQCKSVLRDRFGNLGDSPTPTIVFQALIPSRIRGNLTLEKHEYLSSSNRTELTSLVAQNASSCSVLFSVPSSLSGAQLYLHACAGGLHDRNSVKVGNDRRGVCLIDLVGGGCKSSTCPLLHMPCSGFSRSAIQRNFSGKKICAKHFISGACKNACNLYHLDKEILHSVFIDGRVPAKRKQIS
jgi:serine/threonine protein kinase